MRGSALTLHASRRSRTATIVATARTLAVAGLLAIVAGACRSDPPPATAPSARDDATTNASGDRYAERRARMVRETIQARGITDPRVLAAMRRAPRHELVPAELRDRAYADRPLPIGYEQTISQPFIVAAMTAAAQLEPGDKVLEVGTGSGYQAMVLAELGGLDIYSIEIVEPLAKRTIALLRQLGYDQLHLRIGDGYRGWSEAAPFDAIIVTAAPDEVPQPLLDQLAVGGKLVIPVGEAGDQQLKVITRGTDGVTDETLFDVAFVPMTGEAQRR